MYRWRTDTRQDYINCLRFRELFYDLKQQLYAVVSQVFRGNWRAVRYWTAREKKYLKVPWNGNIAQLDPSTLLIILCDCERIYESLTDRDQISLYNASCRVRSLRNICYGHNPDLQITRAILNRLKVETFDEIIADINQLRQTISDLFSV